MIQVGAQVVVRNYNGGFTRARVTAVHEDTFEWEQKYAPGAATIVGEERLDQDGILWSEGWSEESYNVLRFVAATR